MQRFTAALATLTFGLLILGALVHNTGSSLACPDWPLCHGTAFPRMVGGVLVEHSHRLVAGTVVLMTAALLAWAIRRRRGVGPAALAFALVLAQAALGAVTVLYRLPPLVSTGHLATSMLFFATLLFLVFRLGEASGPALPSKLRTMTLVAAVLIYAQMVLGAAVRHLGAGLACVELPLCKGSLWPEGDVTLHLHMLHRIVAVLALAYVGIVAAVVFRASRRPLVRALAAAAPLLALVQITLGVLTITSFRDIVPLTSHLAVAALLFGDVWALHLATRESRAVAAPSSEPVHAHGAIA